MLVFTALIGMELQLLRNVIYLMSVAPSMFVISLWSQNKDLTIKLLLSINLPILCPR